MDFEGTLNRSAHVAVADSIRHLLSVGRLGPGDRLPTERELAERLGVGRMTVRQAVRLLGEEGLVATRRGRSGGTFILDDGEGPAQAAEVTEELLREVRENFEFRLGIEPLAARLAAERAEEMERWAFRGLAEGEATSVRVFRMLDSRFHLAIVAAARNRLLLQAASQSRAELFRWADAAWEGVDWQGLPAEVTDFGLRHRPIAAAIQAGDADRAEATMAAHLIEGQTEFLAMVGRARMETPA